jgi:hypothetical protein
VDLAGVLLDTDTIIDKSKWVDLTEIKPQPDINSNTSLLSKANEKLIIFDNADDDVNAYTFHITSNQWELRSEPLFAYHTVLLLIFDSINLTLTKGVSTPENLSADIRILEDSAQVLLNGQILFIGGGFSSFKSNEQYINDGTCLIS